MGQIAIPSSPAPSVHCRTWFPPLLGNSPRTVQKHLEHIFAKLGVETRTAAAVKALTAAGARGRD